MEATEKGVKYVQSYLSQKYSVAKTFSKALVNDREVPWYLKPQIGFSNLNSYNVKNSLKLRRYGNVLIRQDANSFAKEESVGENIMLVYIVLYPPIRIFNAHI